MTAVPTTLTAVAGTVLTASQWNTNNRDVENWVLAPAVLEIRATAARSIANGSSPGTVLTFDTEDVDSTGMHSTVTNSSRATAVYPGWYRASGGTSSVANATGQRGCYGSVSGTAVNGSQQYVNATSSGYCAVAIRTKLYFLNVGDYFEIFSVQTSGGALNTSVSSIEQPNMSLHWVSN